MRVGIQGHVLLKHTGRRDSTRRGSPHSGRGEQQTHKVPVHLPHPVSHVHCHVVEQAERVPRRVLENGEGVRTTMTGLTRRMSDRHSQLVNKPIMRTSVHAHNTVG